jgi:hypothetical protein
MTKLSLLLYLADIVNKINGLFLFIMVVSALGFGITILGSWITRESFHYSRDPEKHRTFYINAFKRWRPYCLASFIFFGLLNIIIPQDRTVYMIGAVEAINSVAENTLSSQEIKTTLELSQKILNKKLSEILSDDDKSTPKRN